MMVNRARTHKLLVRIANREYQKQSDLGLLCLSRPFWQATNVRKFRTFTVFQCKTGNIMKMPMAEMFCKCSKITNTSCLPTNPDQTTCLLFRTCFLFDLILYIPVNIFSVMLGQVFQESTSTKQG